SLRRRVVYLLCAAVASFLAWQTKQEAVTLPAFLAAILFLRKRRWGWIVPLAAIAVVLALIILLLPASPGGSQTLSSLLSANRPLVAAGADNVLPFVAYIRTSLTWIVNYYFPRYIAPVSLSIDPDVPPVDHWYDFKFLFAVLVLSFMAYAVIHFSQSEPLLSLGLAGILVSPLLARAAIPLADIVLENRAYVPGIGVAFVFAWAFQWLARD